MNVPAGSPGLILVALALVMTTWTLVPLARARRLLRSASAASLALLAAGLIALGVWGGRIAARLAQLPVDAPVRGQRQDPEPPGPGPCSIPSSIPSLHSGGEDRIPLAGRQRQRQRHLQGQRHHQWQRQVAPAATPQWQRQRQRHLQWQRQRHDRFARLESEAHRATARPIAEHPKHAAVDEPGSGHDPDDRGADRLTWERAQRQWRARPAALGGAHDSPARPFRNSSSCRFSGMGGGDSLTRLIVAVTAGAVFATLAAPSAAGAAVSLGQTGDPIRSCGGQVYLIQSATEGDPRYAVPSGPYGVITSWSFQGDSARRVNGKAVRLATNGGPQPVHLRGFDRPGDLRGGRGENVRDSPPSAGRRRARDGCTGALPAGRARPAGRGRGQVFRKPDRTPERLDADDHRPVVRPDPRCGERRAGFRPRRLRR